MQIEVLEPRTVMSGSPGANDVTIATLTAAPDAGSVHSTQVAAPAATTDRGGNSLAKATNLGALSVPVLTINDFAGTTDANDYYKFSVAGTAGFHLQLNGLSADLDVYLYNASGKVIAQAGKAGSTSEAMDWQLAKGTYYVRVAPFQTASSDYTLKMYADLDKGGDSTSAAPNLGTIGTTPLTATDWVGGMDQYDYYKFTVAQSTDVQINLTKLSQNADLWLFDAKGKIVAYSTEWGSASERIFKNLPKGTYYVDVDPVGSAITTYQLSVGKYAPPPTPTPTPRPGVDPLPDVPYFGGNNDWNLNSINAPESWAAGYTGQGVVVAVVDTGVDYTHSEFAGRIWENSDEIAGNGLDDDDNGFTDDVRGWDFANGDNSPFDDQSHGTHVSGTIAGAFDGKGVTGVAYDATIMAVKVLDSSGSGSFGNVAAGIRYAVDNGARIVNLSLGASSGSLDLQSAIAYAGAHNVLIVAAAGNSSANSPGFPARYAAQYTNVISVGAYDSTNTLAYFSNHVGASGAVQVDAPGVNVFSSLPAGLYGTYSGTSMATPHVVGVAALMLSANAGLTASQLRTLIVAAADHVLAGSDSLGGIDAAWAVAAALNPSSVLGNAAAVALNAANSSPNGPVATTLSLASADVHEFASAFTSGRANAGLMGRATAVEAFFSQASSRLPSRLVEFGEAHSHDATSLARRADAAGREHSDLFGDAASFEAAFGWLGATA